MKIGLEVHCQLLTKTKLFCGCRNDVSKEPNTLTCPTCLGMPGSKPRTNKKATEYAMKIGLALGCKFHKETIFSRKSYFYPDMSKNFQITQYELPFAREGCVVVNKKKIRITRIQLEEDPARLVHVGGLGGDYVLVDYNRSGTPLVEIVTEPDFSSPKEARMFLDKLSGILQYLGVFDPNIEGSMRCDANISLESARVEVKNISGFKEVERALNYEIVRQKNEIRRKGKVLRETRAWDDVSGVTRSLRLKEGEEDYGYIFDTDLPRITIEKEVIEEIKAAMPELPAQKISRYTKELKIPLELSMSIVSEPDLAMMFEQVIEEIDPQLAAKWFAGEIKKTLNYSNLRMKDTGLEAKHLISLLRMIENKQLTDRSAEMMLREIVTHPADPEKLTAKRTRIYDESVLEPVVQKVVDQNPKTLMDYKSGKQEAFNFLVGQIMKQTEGRGDADTIRKILHKKIN